VPPAGTVTLVRRARTCGLLAPPAQVTAQVATHRLHAVRVALRRLSPRYDGAVLALSVQAAVRAVDGRCDGLGVVAPVARHVCWLDAVRVRHAIPAFAHIVASRR
jgi:hypothetical protein